MLRPLLPLVPSLALTLPLLLLTAPMPSGAQSGGFLDRMRERATSRAGSQTENRAGQEVDEAVDQTVDCMFDPIECAKKAKPAETPGAGPGGATADEKPAGPTPSDGAEWYAEQAGSRVGPMPRTQLDAMIAAGQATPQTLVWREGLAEWTAAGRLPELADVFKKLPPPLPKSAAGPPPLPGGAGRSAPAR